MKCLVTWIINVFFPSTSQKKVGLLLPTSQKSSVGADSFQYLSQHSFPSLSASLVILAGASVVADSGDGTGNWQARHRQGSLNPALTAIAVVIVSELRRVNLSTTRPPPASPGHHLRTTYIASRRAHDLFPCLSAELLNQGGRKADWEAYRGGILWPLCDDEAAAFEFCAVRDAGMGRQREEQNSRLRSTNSVTVLYIHTLCTLVALGFDLGWAGSGLKKN